MNKWLGIGRIVRDIEVQDFGENKVARFTLAVNRPFKNKDGEYDADFISMEAWNKTAELLAKFFKKGSQLGIEGSIRTGKFEHEQGYTVYTTVINVDSFHFVDTKTKEENKQEDYHQQMQVADEEDLPF